MIYFVATPIGNLKDITFRAIEVLNSVDIIACEDTRNSLKLLNHYNIKKKLIAYHKFNENYSADGIIELAKAGKNIAIISDAGMPLISDPGNILTKKLKENNIKFTVIGGISAGLCALVLSGLDSSAFTFVGFLPDEKKTEFLAPFQRIQTSLIFYISPHSLFKDIDAIFAAFGDRNAALVKEISKINEQVYNFTLGGNIEVEPIGEFVLVVEGAKDSKLELNNLSIKEHILFYIDSGYTEKEALKLVAKDRKLSKSEIYKENLKKKN